MSEPREKVDISDLKDTFLECPVCVEHFNQTDRRPRLLHSCLHAFCTQCLQQLLEKEGKGQITCPLCRQVQKVTGKADTLPADPVRGKLVEYVQIKQEQRVLCGECEENEAVSRCQECQSYLCKECDFVHRRHRVSRDHPIISLDEVLQQPVKSISKGHFCPSHPKHHLEFYCATEEQLCCVSCTVLDHKGHELHKLDEAAATRKQELEKQMKEVYKLADLLREARNKGTKQEKLIAETKAKSLSDIDDMCNNLKKILEQRKRHLVAAVHDNSSSLLSVVQKLSAAHDQTLAIIESTDTYFTQAKEKADVVEMLQMYPAIKRSVESLQKPQFVPKFDKKLADFTFLGHNAREMETLAKEFGSFNKQKQVEFTVGFLTVSVYKTDLTKLKIDAIVNAANENLWHASGVARAIADAAGIELDKEGRQYVHANGKIPVSGVVLTTAGNMPCQMVLHAVGPAWHDYSESEKQRCFDDLCKTILRCLIEADNRGATGVAIPPISSGIFRVPADLCCEAYVRGTKLFGEYAAPQRSLKEVHFVDVSDRMVNLISDAFLRFSNESVAVTENENKFILQYMKKPPRIRGNENLPTPDSGRNLQSHSRDFKMSKQKPNVPIYTYSLNQNGYIKLYTENIAKVQTESLVSWETAQGQPATEASNALGQAAGMITLPSDCQKNANFLATYSTYAGNLTYAKHIIHAIVPVESLSSEDLNILLRRILDTVNYLCESVAMTPMTSRKVDRKEFCMQFCQVLADSLKMHGTIPQVHIVDKNPTAVTQIKAVFDDLLCPEGEETFKMDVSETIGDVSEKCVICHDTMENAKTLAKCRHTFCRNCIDHYFRNYKPVCPVCGCIYGVLLGNMPPGTMRVRTDYKALPGYKYCGRIVISYDIPDGYQKEGHLNPGKWFKGAHREAYLPQNNEGETVLRLLKVAFDRRLTFTVGRDGKDDAVTWNDIHHKTSDVPCRNFGYPDDDYFKRVKAELAAKGVTEADIDWSKRL